MDKDYQQFTPEEILKHAKKHPHSINVSTEAFSVQGKDYVVHNISMKSDPVNDFDVANYRRGLAFIEQIVNFKQESLRVGKKGLRKFYDLLPEYLESKVSHISNSKHFGNIKNKMIQTLKDAAQSYKIYSTEKANGENAQISWDQEGSFWVIGSKNKTLLLSELKDVKYITHKYEHVRTIGIAEQWFKFLQANPDKVQFIKERLSKYVLVGQICDSVKSGHIVDYGAEVKLYFYALIDKQQRQFSCDSPSKFLQFTKDAGLNKYCVNFKVITVNSFQALIEQLRKEMYRVYEGKLQELGQGTVVYITTTKNGIEHCQTICKVKTLQYRIYRKLREKLKAFFEKFRKSYDKMLNKFIQEVKQLTKGFQTPNPQQYYFHVAKRAFQFSEDQQKAVCKFFHNKFIGFLKLIQNQKIDKQAFKKIMHQEMDNTDIKKMLEEQTQQQQKFINKQKAKESQMEQKIQQGEKQQKKLKKVCVFVGLTIPASGKSTLYKKIKYYIKDIHIDILSSDTVRAQKMQEIMKKQKNVNKKQAYEKTRDAANNQYYRYLNDIFKKMQTSKQRYENYILFLDKNHPENALKKTIEQIKRAAQKCPSLVVKIIGVLPKCDKLIYQKSKYNYPFSTSYVVSCIKRITSRQQHETLQGTVQHRVNICIGFSNMFRNYTISDYNISKYFDGVIRLPFTKQQQIPQQLQNNLIKIMLSAKPGSFDEHVGLQKLIQDIQNFKYEQINYDQIQQEIANTLKQLFQNFQNIKVDVSKFGNTGGGKKQ